MAEKDSKAIQAQEKRETTTPAERMQAGLTFTPPVDIFETEKEITVLADMPGVKADDVNIDLREDILTLAGEVENPEGANEAVVMREYRTGNYWRQFTLSEVIDQDKIEAEMKNGSLRLRLPKVEAATPRKIGVKAG